MDPNIVSFDDIELHKENIEPIREGRSAKALVNAFSSEPFELKDTQLKERQFFEQQLLEAEELDDPLQPYLDYLDWIIKTYPQGQSVESGLVSLLEKCTSVFKDFEFYKNDPRYLKVWIWYIKYIDSPRDYFQYLSRKKIGLNLATYYEEFAKYLEANNRKLQADEIYQTGLSNKARPIERLQKRYDEFLKRVELNPPETNEPNSPAIPPVRSALAVKEISLDRSSSSEPDITITIPKSNKPKMKLAVFEDPDGIEDGAKATNSGGWDTIGSIASRRKENVVEAKSWVGETLPMKGKINKTHEKISIFRDENSSSDIFKDTEHIYKTILHPGKKTERIDLNIDLLYPNDELEFCLNEILAKTKKISINDFKSKTTITYSSLGEVTTTQTVPLNGLGENFQNFNTSSTPDPTITACTKAATDEVLSMFSQPLTKEDVFDGPEHTGNTGKFNLEEGDFEEE